MNSQCKSAIENLPHIANRICHVWGHKEFEDYANKLVMDARDGARKGLPMPVGEELLWLISVNKYRRAIEYSNRLKLDPQQALEKVKMEDNAFNKSDLWVDPLSGNRDQQRRYTYKPSSTHPRRGDGEKTLWGIVLAVVTSKYSLGAIILILAIKAFWPTIKAILGLLA